MLKRILTFVTIVAICCLGAFAQNIAQLQRSAENGDAKAMTELGICYYLGKGVEKSGDKAFQWLSKAVDGGNANAYFWLAGCYENGIGTVKEPKKAFELYSKGADLGDPESMNGLAICLRNGRGTTMNMGKAIYWYTKAAELGEMYAMYNLAGCYFDGNGVAKDMEKAFEWYGKAAEKGHVSAMDDLAYCYNNGVGTNKDLEKAYIWYRKAAELGSAYSMGNLGYCYDQGQGVAVDKEEAYNWYEKAINSGNNSDFVKNRYQALKNEYGWQKMAVGFPGSTWTMKNGDRTIAVYTFNKDNTYTAKYTNYLHAPTGCYWTFTETGTWSLDKGLVTPTPKTFSRPTVRVSPSANWQQKKYPSVIAAMTPGEYSKFLRDDVSASDGHVFKMKSDSQMDVKNSRLTSDYDNTWGTLVKKSGPAASSGKKSATKKRSGSRRR